MKITIIGGGNIGTLMAAEFACKGHEITLFTSKPESWQHNINVYSIEEKLLLTGIISKITNSMQEALEDSEYIWITMPAQLFSSLAEKMIPFVHKSQKIGIVPGGGGAEFAFGKFVEKGCILFGFQRVHSIARIKSYGQSVYQLGRKSELQIAAIPSSQNKEICQTVANLFDMSCIPLDNYLSVTLTPSNSILHTTRLYTMFQNYTPDVAYPRNYLFYEEWNDASSELLIACDNELQTLCNTIPMNLCSVKSLREHYESQTVGAMTKKISSIKAFKGLPSPMVKTAHGWLPDWNSRYFTTDFPFGLKIIKDIAEIFDVPTPNINIVWNWYETISPENSIQIINPKISKENFINIYNII